MAKIIDLFKNNNTSVAAAIIKPIPIISKWEFFTIIRLPNLLKALSTVIPAFVLTAATMYFGNHGEWILPAILGLLLFLASVDGGSDKYPKEWQSDLNTIKVGKKFLRYDSVCVGESIYDRWVPIRKENKRL